MGPTAKILPDGTRLHLQHGPIDLIIGADGQREVAFEAATRRFETVLEELVKELPLLRMPMSLVSQMPRGKVAQRMHAAALPFVGSDYLTRMALVAGSVADEILGAMTNAADLSRAYVNNGGDIALYLAQGTSFKTAMRRHDGCDLGHIVITSDDPVRGIATSGRHGRSVSLGIADSVTVLARTAAIADGAATLIGNAVDLPGHPAIMRQPAHDVIDDSDLRDTPVVVGCAPLTGPEVENALAAGRTYAMHMQSQDVICAAAVFLQDQVTTTNKHMLQTQTTEQLYA